MSRAPAIPENTRARQALASDPRNSAWVSANAGSGKTHVLAQRVIRLLLAGCAPGRILCLTFTKAAAANMAERVFQTLSKWTALDDEALATPSPQPALRARTRNTNWISHENCSPARSRHRAD